MTPEADTEGRNLLGRTDSPYLLQHAENPVHWYPWGEEAFERARATDRPIFLSIGYSTCHWCHVMAHESFEDEEVAELLNEHFVSIKVDREERPDVDAVYMTACQMMTGRGGWPLSVIMTPEGEPFFAGTYFPKRGRGGRPGFLEILGRIVELWEEDREEVLRSADRAISALEQASGGGAGEVPGEEALDEAFRQLRAGHDEVHGGFGSAPKFPSPHNLLFLLRYGHRTGREEAAEMVRTTLHAMRRGGIWDQVGFGFHRYSTDARWFVPHFEKMLYDQALLALACTETWQASGDELCRRTARDILTYLLRDMRDPAGGFHSAEDADSEGGEGKFYVWSEGELREVLGDEAFALAKRLYRTEERGNFVEEASGRRTGENILHLARPLAATADDLGVDEEELRARMEEIREKLFAAREERPRPHRDDKVLTDWNGLAIAALARAGAAFEEAELVEAAREVASFLLGTMRGEGGRLLHRFRDGRAAIPARADDYAFLIWGLIELYGATLEVRWLREALRLQEEFTEFCWDAERGGYFLAPSDATDLPVRPREARDGAVPSANSVAAWNLLRLARMTGAPELEEREEAIERAFAEDVSRAPSGHTQMLVAIDFRLGPTREVVLAGRRDAEELGRMLRILRREFWPRSVVVHRPDDADDAEGAGDEEPEIVRIAAYTREQRSRNGVSAYVCRDFTCERPTSDPEEMRRLLAE